MRELVPLKCLGCAANLEIDPHHLFICAHCGRSYVLIGPELRESFSHTVRDVPYFGVSGTPSTFISGGYMDARMIQTYRISEGFYDHEA